MKIKSIDIFVVFNLFLFILMCIFVYYDRFVTYRGSENILEFYLYAVVTFLVIIFFWLYFRNYEYSMFALCIIEFGILINFAGGLIHIDGKRLYDMFFLKIRYDKFVHFINSIIACTIINRILAKLRYKINKFEGLVIVLIVLGLGAIIEIIEYIVVRNIPEAGVGGYDNNMQDLIANFLGGLFYLFIRYFKKQELDNLIKGKIND